MTKQQIAERYRRWLLREIDQRGWTVADLMRRSELAKQQITPILGGTATQPTVVQIAGFARAMGKEPTAIFEELGFWSSEDQVPLSDVQALYYSLDFIQRRALVRIGDALKASQREYAALMRGPGRPGRIKRPDIFPRIAEPQSDYEPGPPMEQGAAMGEQEPPPESDEPA